MSQASRSNILIGEPVGWIVVRRRGGWNAEPQIVRFTESESEAKSAFLHPEMGSYEPPADGEDVFTYHPVLACPYPVSLPEAVR